MSKFQYTYIAQILKHRTFKNTSYLAIGGILSQLISLIGAFYIPRLLGPGQYGIYQIVISYLTLFGFLSFPEANKIILRECSKNPQQIKEIIEDLIGFKNLCTIGSILVSIIALIFINYDNTTKIYIIIYSSSLLINGLRNSINIVYQAIERMKPIALFQIIQAILEVPLSIIFIKLGYGILALILIKLSVNILTLVINYTYSRKFVKFNIFPKIKILKWFIKQGLTFSLLSFLNTLSGKIDIVMLSMMTTPENVGLYALANNIVQKGLIIRRPISTSLFPYYVKKYTKQKINTKDLFNQTLIIIVPSILIILCVIFSSKLVIITIVGDNFIDSVKILNVLIFYLTINYSIIPWAISLKATNKESKLLLPRFIGVFLNIFLNYILFQSYGIIGIAYSTLITYSISNCIIIRNSYYYFKKEC